MLKLIPFVAIFLSCFADATVHPNLYQKPDATGALQTEALLPRYLIPPNTTQDGFGNCFASAGATYLDILNCKANRAKDDKFDCGKLDPKDSFSRLATGKFGRYMPKAADETKYPGIYAKEGGRNATNILVNVINDGLSAPSQDCASIEKSLVNFQDTKSYLHASEELFRRLELRYNIKKCPSCAVSLAGEDQKSEKEDLIYFSSSLKVSQDEILKAFANETYGEFLEQLLIPNCNHPNKRVMYDGPKNIEIVSFPGKVGFKEDKYKTIADEIVKTLKTQTPLILNNICADEPYDTAKGCTNAGTNEARLHTLIITGYRHICTTDKKPICRDSVRVLNSYGESWQKDNSDGWVDAQALIDRTGYPEKTLTYVKEGVGNNTANNKSKSSTENTGN